MKSRTLPDVITALPDADTMYTALVRRDTTFDGAFIAAIRTTGVFCRPGCGAKKPNRENVDFFATPQEALHAGYRPCRRCLPLEPSAQPPGWIGAAIRLADENLDRRLTSEDLRVHGLEPSRVTRYFKSHYGMTFPAYHRARRIGIALRHVREGRPVLQESLGRGYESESGFRDAFARLFGQAPTRAAVSPTDVMHARWLPTPLGPMLAIASASALYLLEFVDRRALRAQIETLRRRVSGIVIPGSNDLLDRLAAQLDEYFSGQRCAFTIPVRAPGTEFQHRVWTELTAIPAGQTRSYSEVARRIGQPAAVRAVARANGDNRIAILIPCHRVIGADGSLTGYGGGVWRKQRLLAIERGREWSTSAISRSR